MIAEVLTNASAEWLLAGVGALSFLAIAANATMGVVVKKKTMDGKIPNHVNPQPLIVAMEKEFVHRAEYERRHTDVENQVKEARVYAHDEVHAVRTVLQQMANSGENRDHMLHALDERTKTHGRTIEGINIKMDRIVERVADKVEAIVSNRGARHQSS